MERAKMRLESLGISSEATIHFNLSKQELTDKAVERGEGVLTNTGALSCTTGIHTGRSPNDKFIVKDSNTENTVDWGKVNRPLSEEHFEQLKKDQFAFLGTKSELFLRDALAGADKDVQISVQVINETAWANLFCYNLFIRPENLSGSDKADFTIIHTPSFSADPKKHGTNSGTFVVVNFSEGLILIGGTKYAGEMKKSIFTVLNYLYPRKGILAMHCSSNVCKDGKTSAVFFGLSGTGKTTLSANPERDLIGDDEHGWGKNGVFNFEGGCYAKCINLSKEKEPEIWNAIRDGAILENVVVDPETGEADYNDGSLTENTRAAYPIHFISNAVPSGIGPHPKHIIFLTCDAFGVMPPVSHLSPEQAMYHFLSGYTAKVAGTEKGMGDEPQATFSACFGSPFLPLAPQFYAKMLGEKMAKHNVRCWLINTGWVGGAYGTGSRIKLQYTRRIVDAALDGELDATNFIREDFFGLEIPEEISGVPKEILNPRRLWKDGAQYDAQAEKLVKLFNENFKKFSVSPEILKAGPKL